jgi:TrpR-related protein YerC/YecD
MKAHTNVSRRQEAQAEKHLAEALAVLREPDEVRSFLQDLCTPAELQAMSDRWAVVQCLQRGLPYREIHRQTGVSVTTIGRVARYLASGSNGYQLAVRKLGDRLHG